MDFRSENDRTWYQMFNKPVKNRFYNPIMLKNLSCMSTYKVPVCSKPVLHELNHLFELRDA